MLKTYRPITYTLAFVEASVPSVARQLSTWPLKIFRTLVAQVAVGRASRGGLHAALSYLNPLDRLGTRAAVVSTQSRWVAYFDNRLPRPLAEGIVDNVCRLNGCRGLVVVCRPKLNKTSFRISPWKSIRFYFYNGAAGGGHSSLVRSIELDQDYDQWSFSQNGEVQSFEEVDNYAGRDVQSRLTPELVDSYLHRLGIRAHDEDFYGDTWWRFRVLTPFRWGAIELDAAQRDLGVDGSDNNGE